MHCTRCQGLMMEDQFFDLEGTQGFMWMRGWRCVNCGHAVDPVIEANHRLKALTMRARPQEEPEDKGEEVHGYVVLEQLKGNRLLSGIPVLVVTGQNPEGAEQEAREYGAVAFLQKPVKADAVIATLRGVLGQHA